MILSLLMPLLALAGVVLFITAALSPIETLSWWAGWTEAELKNDEETDGAAPLQDSDRNRLYIVYFSGVASISGHFVLPREKAFLKALKKAIPGAVIIDDVFPYSPAGVPLLAAPRFFDRLWRFIQMIKLEGRHTMLSILINMRNIFQVMISADHRYGPIFNQGAAAVIETALYRAGYRRGSGAPIAIIGYSGGAQIAVGAATFLKARLKAPLDVVSIGGVMASDPGFSCIRSLHHIFGDRDKVEKVGAVMFPERWAAMVHSEWNIAKQEGRVVLHKMPNILHAGARGYFGLPLIDGVSNNQRTLKEVVSILSPCSDAQPERR